MSPSRGHRPNNPADPAKVGLPPRPFLYTIDQISIITDLSESQLKNGGVIHYEGRSISIPSRRQMIARNIAPDDQKPEWRVAERELIRWLKVMGFRYYDRGSVQF